jgi:hypothetical protein
MNPNIENVLENLSHVNEVDIATGATYRESAQEVLADEEVSLAEREAVADRLHEVNHDLVAHLPSEDSY